MAPPHATPATAAQDPNEPFDLYTEDGRPLGRSKPRALVHRDGDWHRSLHLWVLVEGPSLLFQRRSAGKDTWPSALDVAVTGHLRAGEGVTEALREAREEIGVAIGPDEVTRLGRRRRVDDHAPGLLDRELQDIYVAYAAGLRAPLAPSALRPDPAEVSGLVALPIASAEALFAGEAPRARGVAVDAAGKVTADAEVTLADFVAARDGYYLRAVRSIRALLEGSPEPPWEIG